MKTAARQNLTAEGSNGVNLLDVIFPEKGFIATIL